MADGKKIETPPPEAVPANEAASGSSGVEEKIESKEPHLGLANEDVSGMTGHEENIETSHPDRENEVPCGDEEMTETLQPERANKVASDLSGDDEKIDALPANEVASGRPMSGDEEKTDNSQPEQAHGATSAGDEEKIETSQPEHANETYSGDEEKTETSHQEQANAATFGDQQEIFETSQQETPEEAKIGDHVTDKDDRAKEVAKTHNVEEYPGKEDFVITMIAGGGSDNKETDTGSQTESNWPNEEALTKELEAVKSEMSFLRKHNARLELNIDHMAEMLKSNNIETLEVGLDEDKLPLYEFIPKPKDGRVKTPDGTSGLSVGDGNESTSVAEDIHPDESSLYLQKVNDCESQIEALKTDVELLRSTLHDAYEREQHYKTLVEQLDNAEAKTQQKWSAFHNGIVQQWSNHCNFLQRQLGFISLKLRQVTEQPKSDGEGSLTSSSADNLENNYRNDQLHQHEQQNHQPQPEVTIMPLNIPLETSTVTNPAGTQTTMITGMSSYQIPAPFDRQPPPPPWLTPDNQRIPYSVASRQPAIPPDEFLQVEPNACAGRMSSARRLHRYFTNMAMIEQAQREGRTFSQRVYDENDSDDGIPIAHAPRRARAFGPGLSCGIQDDEDYAQSEQEEMQLDQEQSVDQDDITSAYTLTPTADPFVPQGTNLVV